MSIQIVPNIHHLNDAPNQTSSSNYFWNKYHEPSDATYIPTKNLKRGFIFWTPVGYHYYDNDNKLKYEIEFRQYFIDSIKVDNPNHTIIRGMQVSHQPSKGAFLAEHDITHYSDSDAESRIQPSRVYTFDSNLLASHVYCSNHNVSFDQRQSLYYEVHNKQMHLLNYVKRNQSQMNRDPYNNNYYLIALPSTDHILRINRNRIPNNMSLMQYTQFVRNNHTQFDTVDTLTPINVLTNQSLIQTFDHPSVKQISQVLAFPKDKRQKYPQIETLIQQQNIELLQSCVDNYYTFPDESTFTEPEPSEPIILTNNNNTNNTTSSATTTHKKKHHKAKHKTNDGPEL